MAAGAISEYIVRAKDTFDEDEAELSHTIFPYE